MKKVKKPSFREEKIYWDKGYTVIGIDEVGRGAFAGPIVAASVIYSPTVNPKILIDINDSKLLSPLRRKLCFEIIKNNAFFWAIELIDVPFINKFGIGRANIAVFRKVVKKLLKQIQNDLNHFILIDGFHAKYLPGGVEKQKAIVKGDGKSLSIASASILAKVYRDELMKSFDQKYPQYGFSKHKGYGTKEHRAAIQKHGLCPLHRTSFNLTSIYPVKIPSGVALT